MALLLRESASLHRAASRSAVAKSQRLNLTIGRGRASFSSCVQCQQRELSSPLQERDNVRNILSLAQQVRRHALLTGTTIGDEGQAISDKSPSSASSSSRNSGDSSNSIAGASSDDDIAHEKRPYSRWWSKSWADVVHAQAGAASQIDAQPVTLGGKPLRELSEALQERLRTPKRMMDSYSSFPLPFRSQPDVLEQYISSWGGVRIGKLLEDLDSLAGDASYKHVLGRRPSAADHEGNPIFIVTASVDRLDLLEPLRSDRDYRLNSMVIYVGSSSMEVLVTVEDISDAAEEGAPASAGRAVLTGRFTMATRNAATGKAQSIPPLRVENEAERQLFSQGQSHKQRKKVEGSTSLEKVPPTSDEAQLVHQLWLNEQQQQQQQQQEPRPAEGSSSSDGDETAAVVHIEDTRLSSVSYMHPQQRNVHMKIFGGYLMRSAYELAFMNASIFARGKPVRFLSLDALSFHLPVSIGAILNLTSYVTYTSTSIAERASPWSSSSPSSVASVVVLAELVDKSTSQRKKSNTFHFSFDLGQDATYVLPQSYRDSIAFIEGKRRVDHGNELRRISQTA